MRGPEITEVECADLEKGRPMRWLSHEWLPLPISIEQDRDCISTVTNDSGKSQ